uniref:Uncharacterized protein n=1 Tax=Alexandrium monilatum TaxID=311494 RepID=A0A7S4T7R1_9DINO
MHSPPPRGLSAKQAMAMSSNGSETHSEVDYTISDVGSLNARGSRLVQLFERRRAAAERALGPAMDLPPPRARLPYPRPPTPPGAETDAWRGAASRMERPAVLRLLNAMQDRLEREETRRKKVEARAEARRPVLRPGDKSWSLASLSLHEQALARAAAKNLGVWPKGAAGCRAPEREHALPKRRVLDRPMSASPAPMATD